MIRAVLLMLVQQALGYVFPLATLTVVSRFLSKNDLGEFLYVQATAAFLALFVEYGYHLSAVRTMTRALDEHTERQAVSEIHGSRLILLGAVSIAGTVILAHNAVLTFSPLMLGGLILAIFSYGFRPLWYYQAVEEYGTAVRGELVGNAASFALIMFAYFVNASVAWVIVCWATPRALATFWLIARIHVRHGLVRIPFGSLIGSLRKSFTLFVHKLAAGCVHLATPVLLGYLVTQSSLLNFQKAERLVTAFQSLLLVISQVGYARVLKVAGLTEERKRTASNITWWQLGAAFLTSVVLYVGAPQLLTLFWSSYSPQALEALRLMCWILPLQALNNALGLNYLLPLHKDRLVVGATVAGAVAAILFLLLFASRLQHLAGVAAVAGGEFVAAVLMLGGIWRVRHKGGG